MKLKKKQLFVLFCLWFAYTVGWTDKSICYSRLCYVKRNLHTYKYGRCWPCVFCFISML